MFRCESVARPIPIDSVQPTQLYVARSKYDHWDTAMRSTNGQYDPVPVKQIGDLLILTDGHSRAVAALSRGDSHLNVVDDTDEMDWLSYLENVCWCRNSGIHSIGDLKDRFVDDATYQREWRDRCESARERLRVNPMHGVEVREELDPSERARVCKAVLSALPEWFGIEEATQEYVGDVRAMDTIVLTAFGVPIGFVSISMHWGYHADLHVLGLLKEFHGRGLGRMMIEEAERVATSRGVSYLTVKTLADTHPDANYARTRGFYETMGFRPFEVFPTLWDESNPCLYMLKDLSEPDGFNQSGS